MSAPPLLKPKVESNDDNEVHVQQQQQLVSSSRTRTKNMEEDNNNNNDVSREEQEEALVALIEHRSTEVQHLKKRISYYNSQVPSFFVFLLLYYTILAFNPNFHLLIFILFFIS